VDRKLPLILTVLLSGCIAFTLAVYFFRVFPFDLTIERVFEAKNNPAASAFMGAVSIPGDGEVPFVLVFAAAAFFAFGKRMLEAVFVLATISSIALAGVLKVLIGRPRPPGAIPDPSGFLHSFSQYSYPSAHVLFFVVFFGFLAFLAWKWGKGGVRWSIISIDAALIVLIGPSRLYLQEHWASDVIGGYIIGVFLLLFLVLLYQVAAERMSRGSEGRRDP
jgi:undecaprenyl-diphosphatase